LSKFEEMSDFELDTDGEESSGKEIERLLDKHIPALRREIKRETVKAIRSGKLIDESGKYTKKELLARAEEFVDDKISEMRYGFKETVFLYENSMKAQFEGRHDDAIELLEMLLERNPGLVQAKVRLARLYTDVGSKKKAIAVWEELHDEESDDYDYAVGLGFAYLDLGWHNKAIDQFEKTVGIDSQRVDAWEGLVLGNKVADRNETALQKCITAMSVLSEHGIESDILYSNAFSLNLVAGNKDEAEKHLVSLVSLFERDDDYGSREAAYIIDELINVIVEEDAYEFLPQLREIIDLYEGFDSEILETLDSLLIYNDIQTLSADYPKLFVGYFNCLTEQTFDLESDLLNKAAIECSFLADLEGYAPYIERVAKEYPRLYALGSEFFYTLTLKVGLDTELKKRIDFLDQHGREPILKRADGSEVSTEQKVTTYRREGRKVGANEPCPCGSGKKYKRCCRR
jgi:tetratricopeptide (TPR) repeat protein